MKSKWLMMPAALAPFVLTMVVLESCGGEGGPVGSTGTSITKEFMALMTPAQQKATYIGSEKCADAACHGGRAHTAEQPIYTTWLQTKHGQNNVGCERCHGPGSVHATNPTAGNILKLPQTQSPVVCAQCHGPTFDQWKVSGHASLILDPVEEAPSNGRTSQCFACHSGLVRTQYTEEGVSLATLTDAQISQVVEDTLNVVPHIAACVTCHEPHAVTGNLDADGAEVQLRHQVTNMDTAPIAPGTTPSSFINYDHACAECHNGRGANGADAKLNSSTARPNMHDSNQMNMLLGIGAAESPTGPIIRQTAHASIDGQCSHCHMGEGRHSFKVSYDTGCNPCHTAADASARVDSLKNEMIDALFALRTKMETYATTNFGDAALWDYTTLIAAGKTPPDQSLVPIELKRSRHNYYFVLRDASMAVHNAAYARYMIQIANTNMDAILPASPGSAQVGLDRNAKYRILMSDLARARQADVGGS